ncbi:DUF4214 domain-containing protein [Prochlorococcus sp. MIT 0801]|uniref:DUF4214 domain-containing protein n=1 Tax=Prochlorococcus sp. MIT 0801 TaxID=1501269 RepID=UPI000689F1D2|nr:DUF4214 domain-containing protein [Prochlorococcus sp. MIT 0801]
MSEISFKTLSNSGVTFTPSEYSIGDSIEWMNSHIQNIQREINLVDESPNQLKIDSAKNTIDYTSALSDLPRLSFTLTIGDDFNLRTVSESGYDTNIAFKEYSENNTGSIGTEVNGSISFNEIDIDINLNGTQLCKANLIGSFSINTVTNNVDLSSNISKLSFVSSNGEEISYKGNLSFSSNDESSKDYFNYLTNSSDIIYGTQYNDNINSGSGADAIYSYGGNDLIDGGLGIDTVKLTGKFEEYIFARSTNSLKTTDKGSNRSTPDRDGLFNDGTNTLTNIEYIQFSDQTVEESKVDVIKTYSGKFSDYKFYNKRDGVYQIKTDSGYDDITGYPSLQFTGEASTSAFRDVSAIVDIKGTFDQVTGLNTDSGRMFRLYNASFKRLPDADGLKYWIDNFSSGINTIRVVASSFLGSAEFKQRYGDDVTDSSYVNTLYKNVLGRDADTGGLNYWLGQLNSGAETRYEVLLGFAESAENKALFTDMTGFG